MRNQWDRVVLAVVVGAVLGGCRTATRVVEEPRVDLEISESGNRGYLVGTPPPVAERTKTTRRFAETEVEVPGLLLRAAPGPAPVGLGEIAPPEVDWVGSYVVKKGDSLWSIAADPKVLGHGTKWRRLYEANRDVLKNPNQLRAGMTLRIPDVGSRSVNHDSSGEGTTTYTK